MREKGRRSLRSSLIASGSKPLVVTGVVLALWLSAVDAWWTPGSGVSWQWQLSGDLDLTVDVDMFNLDLFVSLSMKNGGVHGLENKGYFSNLLVILDVTETQVDTLRDSGVVVICSFSAGTIELDAPDFDSFNNSVYGELVATEEDSEWWLDVTQESVLEVMKARMELAVNKSCDGVEPSNVEVFSIEGTGLNITAAEQITYNTWLAGQAHDRNLSIGLRNDWTQLAELEQSFDWALSENCLAEGECEAYHTNFVSSEKAVLDAEYFQFDLSFCDNVTASGLDVIIKDPSLDERRCSCQNPSTEIECSALLNQSPTASSGGSSYWVIAVAVGGSIFILIVAAVVALWRRRKYGGIGSGGSGNNGGGFEFR